MRISAGRLLKLNGAELWQEPAWRLKLFRREVKGFPRDKPCPLFKKSIVLIVANSQIRRCCKSLSGKARSSELPRGKLYLCQQHAVRPTSPHVALALCAELTSNALPQDRTGIAIMHHAHHCFSQRRQTGDLPCRRGARIDATERRAISTCLSSAPAQPRVQVLAQSGLLEHTTQCKPAMTFFQRALAYVVRWALLSTSLPAGRATVSTFTTHAAPERVWCLVRPLKPTGKVLTLNSIIYYNAKD